MLIFFVVCMFEKFVKNFEVSKGRCTKGGPKVYEIIDNRCVYFI